MRHTILIEREYRPDPACQAAALLRLLEAGPRKPEKEEKGRLQPTPVVISGMPPTNDKEQSSMAAKEGERRA